MALMFPERLSSAVKSEAEKKLYYAFKEQLDDHFRVFHSVKWLLRTSHQDIKDGEADFLIVHPQYGFSVIEVKGGRIRYDGKADIWYSNQHSIKDPFAQARQSKYSLLELLKKKLGKRDWIAIHYGVAFPDTIISEDCLPHAPRQIILDGSQLHRVKAWVESLMQADYSAKRLYLNAQKLDAIVSYFAPQLGYSLGSEIEGVNQRLIQLSAEQAEILNYIKEHRRVAISGCSGSGKTLLAMEKARLLHEQGARVLLTCYNRLLAEFMQKTLGRKKGLYVCNFHKVHKLIAPDKDIKSHQQQYEEEYWFNEIYPNFISSLAERLNWNVDAVIIDEGQDLSETFYIALKCLLKDPDRGIFYFFYDNNQAVYNPYWKPPLDESPVPLTKNWRNSQNIHQYILQYYQGDDRPESAGVEGKPIEVYCYQTNAQLRKILGKTLYRLVVCEQVKPLDIVILTTRKMPVLENKYFGQFLVKAEPEPDSQQIECHTISSFKGLEKPVAILVEHELNRVPRLKNLLYVGASRARNHLIVIEPEQPF